MLFTVIPLPCIGITAIYGDPVTLDHWRFVTLRANKHHLTAPKNAGSLELRNFEVPLPCCGITAIYSDPVTWGHWRSVTLKANKRNLTDPKNARSLEIRNFEGEQAVPDSHAGALERDHCYLR